MGWSDLLPALVTGGTALLGGLASGDSLTGSPPQPGKKSVQPSTAEGQQLLASLQNDILRAKPMNLSVKGVNIPILDPFMKAKARTAKNLMAGEVDGTPGDGGLLGRLAWPIGAAANLLGDVDSSMIDLGDWSNDESGAYDPTGYDWTDLIWKGL
ncbi:hypothetical protein [Desulfoferula mesophila]|uniref:Uncharacterized protein n=1 Tax=Desulfoferula mesophila TaxID=3058419 RepID=A0AAU9EJD9_9BACT|nr:hypothetical protein FAK_23800 [Desulfoferula mesophilus]